MLISLHYCANADLLPNTTCTCTLGCICFNAICFNYKTGQKVRSPTSIQSYTQEPALLKTPHGLNLESQESSPHTVLGFLTVQYISEYAGII